MTPHTIRLLGKPEITVEAQPLSFRTRKVLALFVYLLVEGGTHSREALMSLLWPEKTMQKASIALRVTLSRLRQALQPAGEALIAEGGEVGIDFHCPVDLDLNWLAAAVLPDTAPGELAAIREFDRGEFLAGFSLADAPEFDAWAALQREVCQRQVETVYDRLTQFQLANYQSAAAIETAARWLARAPLSEAAYRHRMAAQVLAGDRPAALRTYEQCREMLQREFGLKPSRETTGLAEHITHGRMQQALESTAAQPGAAQEQPARPTIQDMSLPFEGRGAEHSQLAAAFRQASAGGARTAILIGAAGVGKTRLIHAFQEWAALESPGVEIWKGRAFETGGRLPYQPVIEALRARMDRVNAPEDLLDDVWLAELSQLMPELRTRYPDLPSPMTGDASFMRARFYSAVAALGNALASRQPAVFILDDMQWADADTRDMVQYLANRWAESKTPVLLLLAVRQESFAADAALREWLANLGRDGNLTRLLLEPLSGSAVKQLVARLAAPGGDRSATHVFGEWLWAETGGLPFFIEALLQMLIAEGVLAITEAASRPGYDFASALAQVKSAGRVHVPPGVRDAILSRLDRLSENEAGILLAAAVLGRECSLERLSTVAGITELEALAAVETLLNRRLLTENPTARLPYTPAHDYIREVVYGESKEARRRIFHRRALLTLETNRAPAAECAYHAAASLLDEPAFRFSLIAGEEALRANAFQESLAHFDRAREIARRMGEGDVLIEAHALRQLYQNRGRALELVEDYPAVKANYLEMLDLATERKDQSLELTALLTQCDIHARHTPLFDPLAAKKSGQAALDLAHSLNDRSAEAAALGGLMFAALYGGEENRVTLAYGEASLSLARELGLKKQMGSVLIHLWLPYIAQKQLGAAFDSSREAEAVWRELGNLPRLVETYEMRQFLYKIAAEHEEQFATSSELHRLSRSTGNQVSQGNALAMMSEVHLLQGHFAETLKAIRAAVAAIGIGGHPLWEQSECFFRMDLYLAAGAMDLAEQYADKLYAMHGRLMPMFQSVFLDRIARVKIDCGKLGEGEAILNRALELCSPDNVWSHYVIWLSISEAYLQLALGRPERAFNRLEDRVHSYRQAGFCYNLAEELWLRGKVHLASGKIEEAKKILLEAKTIAEEKEERTFLWQILAALADVAELHGDEVAAGKWRVQACGIIQYIAARAGDEENLRASFLAQPEVVRVMAKTNMSTAG